MPHYKRRQKGLDRKKLEGLKKYTEEVLWPEIKETQREIKKEEKEGEEDEIIITNSEKRKSGWLNRFTNKTG